MKSVNFVMTLCVSVLDNGTNQSGVQTPIFYYHVTFVLKGTMSSTQGLKKKLSVMSPQRYRKVSFTGDIR